LSPIYGIKSWRSASSCVLWFQAATVLRPPLSCNPRNSSLGKLPSFEQQSLFDNNAGPCSFRIRTLLLGTTETVPSLRTNSYSLEHGPQSQKCSTGCRNRPAARGELTRRTFPSLRYRNGFVHAGFTHFVTMDYLHIKTRRDNASGFQVNSLPFMRRALDSIHSQEQTRLAARAMLDCLLLV
jgi:hypothetical protein